MRGSSPRVRTARTAAWTTGSSSDDQRRLGAVELAVVELHAVERGEQLAAGAVEVLARQQPAVEGDGAAVGDDVGRDPALDGVEGERRVRLVGRDAELGDALVEQRAQLRVQVGEVARHRLHRVDAEPRRGAVRLLAVDRDLAPDRALVADPDAVRAERLGDDQRVGVRALMMPCSTSQPMPALRTPTVSSSGTADCTIRPEKPTRRSASTAITCAASPLFMSAAPRP